MNALTNVIAEINKINKKYKIIAIDGRCGSGKTTLGEQLKEKLDATLFHMDDFYLQKWQRTSERLKEIGGNVDYERFEAEVLEPVKNHHDVMYHRFNHDTFLPDDGELVHLKDIVIIEGSYATHPYFGHYYDLGVFCDIDKQKQMENIIKREGIIKAKDFKELWIPKEEAYFNKFHIEDGKLVIHCV